MRVIFGTLEKKNYLNSTSPFFSPTFVSVYFKTLLGMTVRYSLSLPDLGSASRTTVEIFARPLAPLFFSPVFFCPFLFTWSMVMRWPLLEAALTLSI